MSVGLFWISSLYKKVNTADTWKMQELGLVTHHEVENPHTKSVQKVPSHVI